MRQHLMDTSYFMSLAKTKRYNGKLEKFLRKDPGLFSHNRFANICRRGEAVVVEWRGWNFRADFRFISDGVEGLPFNKGLSKERK